MLFDIFLSKIDKFFEKYMPNKTLLSIFLTKHIDFCLRKGVIYAIITKQYRFALMVKRFKTSPSHGGN